MAGTTTPDGMPPGPRGASPWDAGRASLGSGRPGNPWHLVQEPGAAAEPAAAAPEPAPEPAAPAPLSFDEADLARACAGIATTVRAEAEAAAALRDERRIADALDAVARTMDGADAVLAERRRQFREAAATLAAAATEAVTPGPTAKLAARLADALAADFLRRFATDLALTVEVRPEIADALAARLAASPVVEARIGRLAVEAAADLGPGEARLVWADGAAEWSVQRLHDDAAALVRRLVEPANPSPNKEREET